MIPFLLTSNPSPSGFSNASEPFIGLIPEFEAGQLHEYRASQPSGSESESESTEFGSVGTQFWTESELSPCDIIPVEIDLSSSLSHSYSHRLDNPSPSASPEASSGLLGSNVHSFPPV